MRIAIAIALILRAGCPLAAQVTRDWQVQGLTAVFATRFEGAGIGFGVRPPGRVGAAVLASAGDLEGRLAGRFEGLLSFHLDARRTGAVAPYGAAGIATVTSRAGTRGYLEMLLGLEQRPGRKSGWFAEAGVGGGLRVSAGYRFRSGKRIRN